VGKTVLRKNPKLKTKTSNGSFAIVALCFAPQGLWKLASHNVAG
jgi:hypothetical protein